MLQDFVFPRLVSVVSASTANSAQTNRWAWKSRKSFLFYFIFYIALIGKLLIVFFPTNARSKKASVKRKV